MNLQTLAAAHNWNIPCICPVCKSALTLTANMKSLTCSNEFCKSYAAGRISKWTDSLEIKEFGDSTIDTLIENNIATTISDLYKTDFKALANLEGWGESSVSKIVAEINKHKSISLAKFISGYNISSIGEKVIQKIIDTLHYETLEDFINAKSFITEGIKEKTSDKLVEGIKALSTDMLETAKYVSIEKVEKKIVNFDGKLSGKSFCFTGAMDYKRKDLQEMVTSNGGENFDAVKKGLSFLVMADPNSTSSKAVKARSLGIALISPEEFLEMIK